MQKNVGLNNNMASKFFYTVFCKFAVVYCLVIAYASVILYVSSKNSDNSETYGVPRCSKETLELFKGYLIDLDGTIYNRNGLIKAKDDTVGSPANIFYEYIIKKKIPYVFLSNSFKLGSCVAEKLNEEPNKILEEKSFEQWAATHVWTAGHAIASYLEDNFGNEKANILVIGSTVKCGRNFDNCYNVINSLVSNEVKKDWEIRMDLNDEEVLQWARESKNGVAKSVVVFCAEGEPQDSFGGVENENYENLIDPVHGKERSAYKTFTHELGTKMTMLLRNGGVLVQGSPDVLDVQVPITNYTDVDNHRPSIGAYYKFLISASEFDKDTGLLSKKAPVIGKGGDESLNYMINKAFSNLKNQDSNIKMESIAIVGDNLDTDIKAGNFANISSIFILSGVHTISNMKNSDKPTCYLNDVGDIVNILTGNNNVDNVSF